MSVEIVVALMSAATAVFSLTVTLITQRRQQASDEKLTRLREELEEARIVRSEERSRKQSAEEVVAKYREPLLLAAFDLQSRLYNIVNPDLGFLHFYYREEPETAESYARDSTIFVVAQFFGWMEIIRRDIQFLDLGDEEQTLRLREILEGVQAAFRSDQTSAPFLVFSAHQRAIGELMVIEAGNQERECIGYAAFVGNLRDPEFAGWFGGLRSDVAKLASGGDESRLVIIQNRLIDVLDHLDPSRVRFTTHRGRWMTS